MKKRINILCLLLGCIGASCFGLIQIATASSVDDWQAAARDERLSDLDIEMLKTNRVLITNQALPQMFIAYDSGYRSRRRTRSPIPLKFITSDAVLNAYHVLYEESIRCLEIRRANRLPQVLKGVLKNLEGADQLISGRPALVEKAKSRAQLMVGVALRLMDDEFIFGNERLNTRVLAEAEKVVQAKRIEWPSWLERPDATVFAVDYSRYKPRGFYTSLPCLERYFRSMCCIPVRTSTSYAKGPSCPIMNMCRQNASPMPTGLIRWIQELVHLFPIGQDRFTRTARRLSRETGDDNVDL